MGRPYVTRLSDHHKQTNKQNRTEPKDAVTAFDGYGYRTEQRVHPTLKAGRV